MGKPTENKGAATATAGKAPAKQPNPSSTTTGKKTKAVKALEAKADAVVAEVLKVKKTVAKNTKPVAEKPKKAKPVAKKGGAKKNGKADHAPAASGGGGGGRDGLHIPKEIRRRFLRRAGNVRVSDSVLGPLDEVSRETIDDMMLLCVRAAVLAGRSTVQTKDVKRALEILGVHIY